MHAKIRRANVATATYILCTILYNTAIAIIGSTEIIF